MSTSADAATASSSTGNPATSLIPHKTVVWSDTPSVSSTSSSGIGRHGPSSTVLAIVAVVVCVVLTLALCCGVRMCRRRRKRRREREGGRGGWVDLEKCAKKRVGGTGERKAEKKDEEAPKVEEESLPNAAHLSAPPLPPTTADDPAFPAPTYTPSSPYPDPAPYSPHMMAQRQSVRLVVHEYPPTPAAPSPAPEHNVFYSTHPQLYSSYPPQPELEPTPSPTHADTRHAHKPSLGASLASCRSPRSTVLYSDEDEDDERPVGLATSSSATSLAPTPARRPPPPTLSFTPSPSAANPHPRPRSSAFSTSTRRDEKEPEPLSPTQMQRLRAEPAYRSPTMSIFGFYDSLPSRLSGMQDSWRSSFRKSTQAPPAQEEREGEKGGWSRGLGIRT